MPPKSLTVIFSLLSLLSAACSTQVQLVTTATATTRPSISTLQSTATLPPSETPLPPPSRPTVPPVDGATSTQVNVRAEPSTAAEVLGIIPAATRVEITGKDPGENWWQINYPAGPDGKGWVTAQFVVAPNREQIPVIGGDNGGTADGPVAIIQQQLNVRSGPGTGFDSLGTLNPQDVVGLTGKDANGAWLQIDFPAGPEGKGWVNAAFVQAQGVENLPIITEAGVIVGTGTPTPIPPTPTATIVPAWEDNDSATNPIARVIFEPAGTQSLIYNGDLSVPQGDAQDWIAFTPYKTHAFVSVECEGNGSLKIDLTEDGRPVEVSLVCNEPATRMAVKPGAIYILHVQVTSGTSELQYVNYVLTVKTNP